jgi:hypothetical protein
MILIRVQGLGDHQHGSKGERGYPNGAASELPTDVQARNHVRGERLEPQRASQATASIEFTSCDTNARTSTRSDWEIGQGVRGIAGCKSPS